MKIEKIIENNDENKDITEISAYAILALINNKLSNDIKLNEKAIIAEFFTDYDYDIEYDKLINIADTFINNNFSGYKKNLDNTMEIPIIKK